MGRVLASLFLLAALCSGQQRMSVSQLRSFIKSSSELHHEDKKVAQYLKQVVLTEKLDEDRFTELLSLGVGERTAEALRALMMGSKSLPAPAAEKPRPAAAVIPPPSEEEQRQLIEEIREYAINYAKRLPDFICTQVTRRYIDPTGLEFWQRQDVVTAKLSYFEQKEDYKVVLINSRPVDLTMDKIEGTTSQGEFGSLLKEIFEPETEAEFAWVRWATLGGRRAHVIRYRVRQDRSKWSVSYQRTASIVPAYSGLVYVDRDSRTVLRVTLDADGIPPTFPVQEVSTILDYDFVAIGEARHMLPLKFVTRMREAKFLAKNEVEFRMYRKFGADTVITFETPEPLPDTRGQEAPPKP